MKVVLVNPSFNQKGDKIENNEVKPDLDICLGLLVIQTVLSSCGIETEIVDLNLLKALKKVEINKDYYINSAALIAEKNPDFVGITSMSNNFINAILIAEETKKILPNCQIFMGGPQASFIAKEAIERFSFIDFICRGESEKILPELAEYFKGKKSLESIPGITCRGNDCIIENPAPAKLVSGEEMIMVDYSYLVNTYFKDINIKKWVFSIEGGRGCPYNCVYCSTNKYWNRTFRFKKISQILDEMDHLNREYGASIFTITHDLFTCNRKDLLEFCGRIKERGYRWGCSSRVDVLDEETIKTINESGCIGIFFGIETGDQDNQRAINKNLDLEYADKVIKMCGKLDMQMDVSFIIGFPDETIQSIENTLCRILKYSIAGVCRYVINVLIPEHGSQLMDRNLKTYFEEALYLYNTDIVSADKEKEMTLVKENPNLFNHYYYYESKNFNAYFLESITMLFMALPLYFKYTLYALTTIENYSIIDIIYKTMKWRDSYYLGEKEFLECIESKDEIYKKYINYFENEDLKGIIRSLFEYERDIVKQLKSRNTEKKKDEIPEEGYVAVSSDVVIGRYKHNIAKFIYGIKHDIGVIDEEEDFCIASKVFMNGERINMNMLIINPVLADFFMKDRLVDIPSMLDFIEEHDSKVKKGLKELINKGLLVGDLAKISEKLNEEYTCVA